MGKLYGTKEGCSVPLDTSQNFLSSDLETANNVVYPPIGKLKATKYHKISETLFCFSIASVHR